MKIDIKRFDIYRKISKDLTEPTKVGAIISITCSLIILFLLFFELNLFLSPEIVSELFVDNVEEAGFDDKINVKLNISLPNLQCKYVGLDIQDDMGRHEVGFLNNTNKVEINNNLGCNFESTFLINKVPGNFHISTHSAETQPDEFDMRHIIHTLKFGEDLISYNVLGNFDSLSKMDKRNSHQLETHEYHLKIVPTIYEDMNEFKLSSFQYIYGHKKFFSINFGSQIIPAIWFKYDLNPITIKYHRKRKPLYSFLTTICAIIGGVFTIAGIIDSIIFTTSNIFKKFQLDKLS